MEEAADFEGCCWVVDYAAVNGEAGVCDEDFYVGWKTAVWQVSFYLLVFITLLTSAFAY